MKTGGETERIKGMLCTGEGGGGLEEGMGSTAVRVGIGRAAMSGMGEGAITGGGVDYSEAVFLLPDEPSSSLLKLF